MTPGTTTVFGVPDRFHLGFRPGQNLGRGWFNRIRTASSVRACVYACPESERRLSLPLAPLAPQRHRRAFGVEGN